MKRLILIIMLFGYYEALSQVGVIDNQVKTNTYVGAEIFEKPVREPGLIGSYHLYDEWTLGNINLKSGTVISDTPLKYDILHQEILLMQNKKLLGVKVNFVERFELLTHDGIYLNFLVNNTWTLDGASKGGVYQKLTNIGAYGLLKETKVVLIKANYNVALDAGVKDDHYKKIEVLYFLNNSTRELEKVPRGRKKILQYFENEKISEFSKTNHLDLKSESGLIALVDYSNALVLNQ